MPTPLLLLPIAIAYCYCLGLLLLLRLIAIAIVWGLGYCLLLLPIAVAYCYCLGLLLLPIAIAYCLGLLLLLLLKNFQDPKETFFLDEHGWDDFPKNMRAASAALRPWISHSVWEHTLALTSGEVLSRVGDRRTATVLHAQFHLFDFCLGL